MNLERVSRYLVASEGGWHFNSMLDAISMERFQRYSVCPLCEAGCGFAFKLDENDGAGGRVVEVGPNHQDVISNGFICPKGAEMLNLDRDLDRLREPMQKRRDAKMLSSILVGYL